MLRDQGDLGGALSSYREALSIIQRLAQADPTNAGWQRDLSYSLTLLAQLHEKRDERQIALDYAERGLTIAEKLAALDKTNATWQKDVAISRALVARLRGAD